MSNDVLKNDGHGINTGRRVLGQVGYSGSNAWVITTSADTAFQFSSTTVAVLKSKKDTNGNLLNLQVGQIYEGKVFMETFISLQGIYPTQS